MSPTNDAYFKSHDNHRLYYQAWTKPDAKAVLVFVHGLNEHSGRYTHVASFFQKLGYAIYLFDHRGHGKSDGLRSFVDDFSHYMKDIDEFLHVVQSREKGKKIFLVGHSMGGQIVLNYVGRYRPSLAGFITSSPNVQTALKIPCLKKMLGIQIARFFPKFSIPNEIDCRWISHDEAVVEAYANDPLVSKRITLGLVKQLMDNQKGLLSLAERIELPALMMHSGDDKICDVDGSKKFYRKLASRDKTLKVYEGFYHELFNEVERKRVFEDMREWLAERV